MACWPDTQQYSYRLYVKLSMFTDWSSKKKDDHWTTDVNLYLLSYATEKGTEPRFCLLKVERIDAVPGAKWAGNSLTKDGEMLQGNSASPVHLLQC